MDNEKGERRKDERSGEEGAYLYTMSSWFLIKILIDVIPPSSCAPLPVVPLNIKKKHIN